MGALLDDLITTDEAAALLRVKKSWLYDACASGRVPHTKVDRFLRFSRRELEEWLASNHVTV